MVEEWATAEVGSQAEVGSHARGVAEGSPQNQAEQFVQVAAKLVVKPQLRQPA